MLYNFHSSVLKNEKFKLIIKAVLHISREIKFVTKLDENMSQHQ